MAIFVLRLGHRKKRDKRVTTHVCLAARALGANGAILCGERDEKVIESVKQTVRNWGGKFSIDYNENWRAAIKNAKKDGFTIVHLTMYGEKLEDVVPRLKNKRKLFVVVGAGKVPGEVYSLADFNVSVSNQPHSEVAALAIFLHVFFDGKELNKRFPGAVIRIVPQKRGKKILREKNAPQEN